MKVLFLFAKRNTPINCSFKFFPLGIAEFWKEAAFVSRIRPHVNILMFLGVVLDPLCLVVEYLSGGDLKSHLKDTSKVVDNHLLMRWFAGITSGMLHLSLENIVHRDLAARNVLLTSDLNPKIADFGMSRAVYSVDDATKTNAVVGPLKWVRVMFLFIVDG
jgi:epidermal growth factor receptor